MLRCGSEAKRASSVDIDTMFERTKLYRAIKWTVRPLHNIWVSRSNAAIFNRIYKKRLWGVGSDPSVPFYSGVGSYDPSVRDYVDLIRAVIKKYNIQSVVEIGCGDFAVASQYVDVCRTYTGIDVVKSLVEHNSRIFGSEKIRFIWSDASKHKIESSDLCIIRQVLQHLTNKDIENIFKNISSKFLLITEHLPSVANTKSYNLDKKSGAGIRVPMGSGVFIDKPPFNLNAEVLMERNVVSDIHAADERLVTWLVINIQS
jgi:hypothetical protein